MGHGRADDVQEVIGLEAQVAHLLAAHQDSFQAASTLVVTLSPSIR